MSRTRTIAAALAAAACASTALAGDLPALAPTAGAPVPRLELVEPWGNAPVAGRREVELPRGHEVRLELHAAPGARALLLVGEPATRAHPPVGEAAPALDASGAEAVAGDPTLGPAVVGLDGGLRVSLRVPRTLALGTRLVAQALVIDAESGRPELSNPLELVVVDAFVFELDGEDLDGWVPGFSGPHGLDGRRERTRAGHGPLPLDPDARGVFLATRGEGFFLFLKRRLAGLSPGHPYRVGFDVELATDMPALAAGDRPGPAARVWCKVGAAPFEPQPVRTPLGVLMRMNVDVGLGASGGGEARVLGDLAGAPDAEPDASGWRRVELDDAASEPLVVTSAEDGTLWLYVGVDTGGVERTALYVDRVVVRLR